MTINEFLEELTLARADAGRGARGELQVSGFVRLGRTLSIRVRYPHGDCDCPVNFLARSMGLIEGDEDWNYLANGRALGLDEHDVELIIAAADGKRHQGAVNLVDPLRLRICEALGIHDAARQYAALEHHVAAA
jgi:hypothetical protein